MAKLEHSRIPKEIPLEPFYYSFLLDSIPDRSRKSCIKAALDKYNKTCMKAFKELQDDLKKCPKTAEKKV